MKVRRKEMFYLTTHSQQRQDNTYHGLCYTNCDHMHANALTTGLHLAPPYILNECKEQVKDIC